MTGSDGTGCKLRLSVLRMRFLLLGMILTLHTFVSTQDDGFTTEALQTSDDKETPSLVTMNKHRSCDKKSTDAGMSSSQRDEIITRNTSSSTPRCNCTDSDVNVECSNAPSPSPEGSIANTVIRYVGYITVPVFLVFSLTGNCMTIIVMISKKFWNSPCSILLIALAISDSTYSIVFPFSKLFVRELIGYDIRALSSVGCHVFFIVHKGSKIASSWFIVAICAERFIAVWFPLKAGIICSKRNTMIVVLVISGAIFTFTGFWTFSTVIINGICIPNYATPDTAVLARVYLMAGSAVFSVIPAAILLILTPAICYKLIIQMKLRRQLLNKKVEDNTSSEMARTNAMLLGVTIAYIVLVTPTAIAHNVFFSLNINFYETNDLAMTITRAVLQVMEQLNFSINFWMYVMCNRSFRKRAMEVLKCGRQETPRTSNSIRTCVTVDTSSHTSRF
ncbi:alpha-1A adrenergic receptor-like [Haliotis asinina]|uniref:alpha-1A adrenergic receptor-like n=1 Tax=Haliotis asinina TaxID=109174 RepID=UPI0035323845